MALITFLVLATITILCICNQNKIEAWLSARSLELANRRTRKMTADKIQAQALKAQKLAAKERERDKARDRVRIYRMIEAAAVQGQREVSTAYYTFPEELKEELRGKGYTVEGRYIKW